MDRGDPLEDGGRGRQPHGFKVGQDDHDALAALSIPTNCSPRAISGGESEAAQAGTSADPPRENLRLLEAEKAAVCYARAVHILQVSLLCDSLTICTISTCVCRVIKVVYTSFYEHRRFS